MRRVGYRVRAVLLLFVLALSLTIFVPVLWLFVFAPLRMRFRFSNIWCRFFVTSLRWLVDIDCRVTGLDRLPACPCVYFVKHQSTWETLALQTILPTYVWILKREALRIPIFGWGLATLTPIAIDRRAGRTALEQIIEQGTQRLREGLSVVIFPEGTRVPVGEEREFKVGGALLALAGGAPIVPIALNSGVFWPAGKALVARAGIVDVSIGMPFDPDGMDAAVIVQHAKHWIDQRTHELVAGAMGR